jgi:hypothetical protein
MSPSPIAFHTLEKITAAEVFTPKIRASGNQILDHQKTQNSHVVLTPKLPATAVIKEKKETVTQTCLYHSEGKKRLLPSVHQSEAKVYPAGSPTTKSQKSPLVEQHKLAPL